MAVSLFAAIALCPSMHAPLTSFDISVAPTHVRFALVLANVLL
jgi:hypothetical protein